MNNIGEKQNNKKYLILQYAAGVAYNNAELLNCLLWILCIFLVIIPYLDFFGHLKIIFTIIATLLCIYLRKKIKDKIKLAAATRYFIDYSLFGFQIDQNAIDVNKIQDHAIKIYNKNISKANIKFANSGDIKPNNIINWYVNINSNGDLNSTILACQEQNYWWDKNLTRNYVYCYLTIILGAIIVMLSKCIDFKLYDFIYMFLSIGIIISKVLMDLKNIVDYFKLSYFLKELFNLSKLLNVNTELLLFIQNKIDERRNLALVTPNIIHKIKFHQIHKFFLQREDFNI